MRVNTTLILRVSHSLILRLYHTLVLRLYHTLILRLYNTVVLRVSHFLVLRLYHTLILRLYHSVILRLYHTLILRVSHSLVLRVSHSLVLRLYHTLIMRFSFYIFLHLPDESSGPEVGRDTTGAGADDGAGGDPGDDDNIEVEDFPDMLNDVAEKWLMVQLTHQVSASATNAFWSVALQSIPNLVQCKTANSIKKNIPGYIHLRRKIYENECPEVKMKFVYQNKNTQAIEIVHSNTNPSREYDRNNYVKLYEEAHIEAKDILEMHKKICPNNHDNPVVNFSLDGVQESRSSSTSLDVYCIKFHGCRNIYPVRLIRPNEKYKYDEQQEIREVVNDLNETSITIDAAIFDKPKRSVVTLTKSHAAKHPCEYCECGAISYINDAMQRRKLTWPPATMNGRPRTITSIRRIVNSIEEGNHDLTQDDLKGIKGRSVFLDQQNFDYVLDIPCEYMHCLCLGTGKKMVEFTYKLGKKRNRVTTRPRTDPKLFNDLISLVLVPREFPRRCRNLDTAVYKAQEYRNLILFMFPIVLKNIGEDHRKESQLWLALVFMVRSCIIPNEEFDNVSKESISKSCELFYNLYFEVYGQENCIYTVHIVGSHLFKIRGNSPLTERSAFPFESFYSEMKNSFKPGTPSPLKQVLRNTIMKRRIEFHKCQKTILYTPENKNSSLENNSLIYTYNNGKHDFFVISEINDDVFTCKRQGKFEFKPNLLPTHDWKSIGVYRTGPIGTQTFNIHKNEVKGKAINVLNMTMTCPINVLLET